MILLWSLIALGVGALAVYASPKGRAWVDEHMLAVKDASAAHEEAEVHMEAAAQAAPPSAAPSAPDRQQAAQHHAVAAQTATTVAAQKTAQAAQTAQTPAERATATWMAALTLAMQDQIKAFGELQIARSTSAPTADAQRAFDLAVVKIAEAKAELAKLIAQKTAQMAQTAQTQAQRAAAAWMAALTLATQERDSAQLALHKVRGAGAPTAVLERSLDAIRARIAEARGELAKLGLSA